MDPLCSRQCERAHHGVSRQRRPGGRLPARRLVLACPSGPRVAFLGNAVRAVHCPRVERARALGFAPVRDRARGTRAHTTRGHVSFASTSLPSLRRRARTPASGRGCMRSAISTLNCFGAAWRYLAPDRGSLQRQGEHRAFHTLTLGPCRNALLQHQARAADSGDASCGGLGVLRR